MLYSCIVYTSRIEVQAWTRTGIAPQCVPLQLPEEVLTVLSGHRIRRHAYGYTRAYIWLHDKMCLNIHGNKTRRAVISTATIYRPYHTIIHTLTHYIMSYIIHLYSYRPCAHRSTWTPASRSALYRSDTRQGSGTARRAALVHSRPEWWVGAGSERSQRTAEYVVLYIVQCII